jgi:signal recognition particle receptor subunit beta
LFKGFIFQGFGIGSVAIFKAKDGLVECKVVYYGPGRGGKTTNLEYIFKTFKKQTTGEMISINTQGDQTLFFDLLPMGLGEIKGWDVKLQLYTVPGQVRYRSTRKMVLNKVDGVVFVADSLQIRQKANMLSLRDLQQNLAEQNMSIFKIPLVLQYNKRDLTDDGMPVEPIEVMERDLNGQLKVPSYPASALRGTGVGDCLRECLKLTLQPLHKELNAIIARQGH